MAFSQRQAQRSTKDGEPGGPRWMAEAEENFNGEWEDDEGALVLVRDGKLYGPDGGALNVEYVSATECTFSMDDETYHGTVEEDRIVWKDGAIWVRKSQGDGLHVTSASSAERFDQVMGGLDEAGEKPQRHAVDGYLAMEMEGISVDGDAAHDLPRLGGGLDSARTGGQTTPPSEGDREAEVEEKRAAKAEEGEEEEEEEKEDKGPSLRPGLPTSRTPLGDGRRSPGWAEEEAMKRRPTSDLLRGSREHDLAPDGLGEHAKHRLSDDESISSSTTAERTRAAADLLPHLGPETPAAEARMEDGAERARRALAEEKLRRAAALERARANARSQQAPAAAEVETARAKSAAGIERARKAYEDEMARKAAALERVRAAREAAPSAADAAASQQCEDVRDRARRAFQEEKARKAAALERARAKAAGAAAPRPAGGQQGPGSSNSDAAPLTDPEEGGGAPTRQQPGAGTARQAYEAERARKAAALERARAKAAGAAQQPAAGARPGHAKPSGIGFGNRPGVGLGLGAGGLGRLSHAPPDAAAAALSGSPGALHPGLLVQLDGLRAKPELNGVVGLLVRFDSGRGRWQVRITGREDTLLKEENLRVVSESEYEVMKDSVKKEDDRVEKEAQAIRTKASCDRMRWCDDREGAIEKAPGDQGNDFDLLMCEETDGVEAAEKIVDIMADKGFAVIEANCPHELISQAFDEAEALWEAGEFGPPIVFHDEEGEREAQLWKDVLYQDTQKVFWIDPEDREPRRTQKVKALKRISENMLEFARGLSDPLARRTEVYFTHVWNAMLSCYTGDNTYSVHIDNPHAGGAEPGRLPDNGLRMTLCYYINPHWNPDENYHGGGLDFFLTDPQTTPASAAIARRANRCRVAPHADTLVLWLAERMAHQVVQTKGREKFFCLTMWCFHQETLSSFYPRVLEMRRAAWESAYGGEKDSEDEDM